MEAIQCTQPDTTYLADHPREWFHVTTQCCSLVLTDLTLNICYSQVRLNERQFILLSSYITSFPATIATLIMSPLGIIGVAGERGWFTWLLKCFSAEVRLWCAFTEHKHLHVFFLPREVYPHTSSPGFLIANFLIIFLPRPWPSPKPSAKAPESVYNYTFLLSSKVHNPVHCSNFWPLGRFTFITVLQGSPRKGLWCCSCPFSRWCLHSKQNHV